MARVPIPRSTAAARTLVELTDTFVDDFDVVELFTLVCDRCVDVLNVAAAGLVLVTPEGELRVMASSGEVVRRPELFDLLPEQGPGLDCCRSGAPVHQDLAAAGSRWPRFAPLALGAGLRSAHALPLRWHGRTIGALNLLRVGTVPMAGADVGAAQAFADVAAMAMVQHRAALDAPGLDERLHEAIESRVLIEEAAGILRERAGLDVSEAFAWLRATATSDHRRLSDVARSVVDGDLLTGSPNAPAGPGGSVAEDDTNLVAGLAQGDQSALEGIYRRYGAMVWGLARKVCRDPDLAQDVAHTVFTALWSEPERFDPARGSLRVWLALQTHSRAVDAVRSETAYHQRHEHDAKLDAVPPADELDAALDTADLAGDVRRALSQLPDGEREVITLAYFGGHTYRETAALLGQPEGTTKSRIRTGLQRLRVALEAEGRLP